MLSPKLRSRPLRMVALVVLLLAFPQWAGAQAGPRATLQAPQTGAFPLISAYLDVRGPEGAFVSGLAARDLTVLEDETRLPVETLAELEVGAQLVVAINGGATFAIRDAQGLSRYDILAAALRAWGEAQGRASQDDLSLLMNAAPGTVHTDPAGWLEALATAPTDYRNTPPNFQLLLFAIEVAADPTLREGMGRAVLFITPNPEQGLAGSFQVLATRAAAAGVRVHVWMVSSEAYFGTSGVVALREMAVQTGGTFFTFSGAEPVPDVEAYLEPLRRVYQLVYRSQIRAPGAHRLAVEVAGQGLVDTTPAQTFELNVAPPNPMLVSPPTSIYRAIVPATGNTLTRLAPALQVVKALIEFPDGYERKLVRTTLYVDGQIAAENTAPPFDQFQWDLGQYIESGRHMLQVEAVDEWGLSSLSMATPVDITAQRPVSGLAATLGQNGPILAATAVLMAGAILILVLVLASRLRPQPQTARSLAHKRREQDPVYQSVPTEPEPQARRGLPRWASQLPNRLHWPQRTDKAEPFAYLERLLEPGDLETLIPTRPFSLTGAEITLGADPAQATLVLEDPSVSPLHARLWRDEAGHFSVRDQASTAGTWVNYGPAADKGTPLLHGDLIHVGRVGFRFKLHAPPPAAAPRVIFEGKSPQDIVP